MYIARKWDIVPEVGDIWYRAVPLNGDYFIAYYLLLKVSKGSNSAFPYEYRMLPLTPHLDKTCQFQYEAALNRWPEWEKAE